MAKSRLKEEEKRSLNKENIKKLYGIFRFLMPYRNKYILGIILLIISSALMLSFPFFTGKLIDVASGNGTWIVNDINLIALGLLGIFIVQSFISFFRVYLFAQVTEQAMADVRTGLFEKTMHLPISFYDRTRTGELMSRISADVTLLQNTFSTTLAEFIRQIITLIAGITMIFLSTPRLSLFMLAIFPVVILIAIAFGKSIRKYSKATQDELAGSSTIVEEAYQAIAMVKSFANELFEINRYQTSMQSVVKTALRSAFYRSVFLSFIIFALFGSLIAIIWYGGVLLQEGNLSSGELITFVLYTAFIGGSIAGLGDMFGQVQRAIGSSQRLLDIYNETTEETFREITDLAPIKGNIKFDAIYFSYPTRDKIEVLKGVSFELKAGEKMALVGPSGAGKSTIIQLLMRMYDTEQGHILIDDVDIKSYGLKHLRQHIGIVPQEVILFGGTIKENIAYGKTTADMDQIITAAQQANALEFIESFPDGFDTIVGERGVKLSGGQRQRIAIARAILKDPEILILDEATSSLDNKSERMVQEALDKLMKDRTTIVIAHRLSTIRKVDKIYVLEDGIITESGTHDDLLNNNKGTYKSLVELQLHDA